MMNKKSTLALTLMLLSGYCMPSFAGPEISAGVWWVYQNGEDDGAGEFADPALVIYADDDGSHGPWGFSAEARIGTGSFTDPQNNNSGDNFAVHKAWISYAFSETDKIVVGKSQVPFGWKTSNFWPGDMLQGGYGDQMDVGFKYSGKRSDFSYDAALYLQDDWGSTSTDTTDDNRHWGASADGAETFRKTTTAVVNLDWSGLPNHTFGVSYQQGNLRDLAEFSSTGERADDGDHSALDLHYYYQRDNFTLKYRYVDVERDFSDLNTCVALERCPTAEVSNTRNALHLGYSKNDWSYYFELTTASTDTEGNDSGTVKAFAPGITYDYGPGWIYLEYLWQDGYIDRFGDVGEGDFKSLYLSFDFYF